MQIKQRTERCTDFFFTKNPGPNWRERIQQRRYAVRLSGGSPANHSSQRSDFVNILKERKNLALIIRNKWTRPNSVQPFCNRKMVFVKYSPMLRTGLLWKFQWRRKGFFGTFFRSTYYDFLKSLVIVDTGYTF